MKRVLVLISSMVLSVSAIAAPSVESYLPAIEALSAANDERGSNFTASVVTVTNIASVEEGTSQIVEVIVLAKEDESSAPYAKDVYLLTVGEYASLKNIQFVERILLKN